MNDAAWAIWDPQPMVKTFGNWVSIDGKVLTTNNKLVAHEVSRCVSAWEVREYLEQIPGTETIDIWDTPFRRIIQHVEP